MYRNTGSLAGAALEGDSSTQGAEPFADTKQAKGLGGINILFGNATTVIVDLQHQLAIEILQTHDHVIRLGMAYDVGQELLKNTKKSGSLICG